MHQLLTERKIMDQYAIYCDYIRGTTRYESEVFGTYNNLTEGLNEMFNTIVDDNTKLYRVNVVIIGDDGRFKFVHDPTRLAEYSDFRSQMGAYTRLENQKSKMQAKKTLTEDQTDMFIRALAEVSNRAKEHWLGRKFS